MDIEIDRWIKRRREGEMNERKIENERGRTGKKWRR